MRNTILFKKLDLGMQLLLAVTALGLVKPEPEAAFVTCYFLLGGWQLISALVHGCDRNSFYRVPLRRVYEKTLLWVFIIGLVTIPLFIFFLFAMLFAGPLMAIMYIVGCFQEIALLHKREMVHLR